MPKRTHVRKARCDIALLIDQEAGHRGRKGVFVPDRNSVEAYLLAELSARHGRVVVVPFETDVSATVAALAALKPRLVFNLTECLDGNRRLDHAIAGVLDLMALPYTGTGPAGLLLARDKALSKHIVASRGVAVPRYVVAARVPDLRCHGLAFPVIVKPQFGDASEGISRAALVRDDAALRTRVRALVQRLRQPVICEEFVPGRDLYVGLIGNGRPEVVRPVELVIGRRHRTAPLFATEQLKGSGSYRTRWRVGWRRARLPEALLAQIRRASRAVFAALEFRDYGRVDFRLAPDGRLVFIEANPNPDLHPHAYGNHFNLGGGPYRDLVERIVRAARRRCAAEG
jgi:D-alanine-D-alanine ligase